MKRITIFSSLTAFVTFALLFTMAISPCALSTSPNDIDGGYSNSICTVGTGGPKILEVNGGGGPKITNSNDTGSRRFSQSMKIGKAGDGGSPRIIEINGGGGPKIMSPLNGEGGAQNLPDQLLIISNFT